MNTLEFEIAPRNAVLGIRLVLTSYLTALAGQIWEFTRAYRILSASHFYEDKAIRPFVLLALGSALVYALLAVVIVKLNDRSNVARTAFALLVMFGLAVTGIRWVLGDAPLIWYEMLIRSVVMIMQLWAVGLLYSTQCEGWLE